MLAWLASCPLPRPRGYNLGSDAAAADAFTMRSLALLSCASVQAIGLQRRGAGSLSLLAPDRMEMQCESGCHYRPFCMPGICDGDADCATKPVMCSDETWESCGTMTKPCPAQLRSELCADARDMVCNKRMGVEVYDREAQAAERAAAEEAERAAHPDESTPPPPKVCMSMIAKSEDKWCTMMCNTGVPSDCDPKVCRCGSDEEIEGWRKEKKHKEEFSKLQPWDVKGACELEARGCNQKLEADCALAVNATCVDHLKQCMEAPLVDENNQKIRVTMQDCLDQIAENVDECNSCNNSDSHDAFTLYLGPNYENQTMGVESDELAAAAELQDEANKEAFEATAAKIEGIAEEKAAAAEADAAQREEEARAAAIAATISPPPDAPPSPPDAPGPPAAPALDAKDLLEISRKHTAAVYTQAKERRVEAQKSAKATRDVAEHLPAGEEQTAALELADQAEQELTDAKAAEAEAKAAWEAAVEALNRFTGAGADGLPVSGANGLPEAPGKHEEEAAEKQRRQQEEKRSAQEANAMAAQRNQEAEEQKRLADEAAEAQRKVAEENDRIAAEAKVAWDASTASAPGGGTLRWFGRHRKHLQGTRLASREESVDARSGAR